MHVHVHAWVVSADVLFPRDKTNDCVCLVLRRLIFQASIIFLIQYNTLFRDCFILWAFSNIFRKISLISHVRLCTRWCLFLERSEMNVACLHIHLPVSVCLCVQICMHCRLEFIFGCLFAKKRRLVHLYVNVTERYVERAAYAYWCVSAHLLLICLIHPSVCICLMNRIL